MAKDAVQSGAGAKLIQWRMLLKNVPSVDPAPPFITSTLQQEAARKLYFAASQTMQVAQKLYEGFNIGGETVGLITYMRTDGTQLSDDAVDNDARLY